MRLSIPTIALLALAAGSCAAADAAPVPGVSGASFVQGLFGLIFVIGLLLGAAWLMRRLGAGGVLGSTRGMKVISGLAVGPRERILLLEVGETWIVVGVSAGRMRKLHSMPRGELPEAAEGELQAPLAGFLKQLSGRRHDAH